ncbi:MAG: hypothetical protein GX267_06220 [Fibrobacter sp.]|jgi:hypothetical protein|nr:hypothetical protein [Fibrobacter sp.]
MMRNLILLILFATVLESFGNKIHITKTVEIKGREVSFVAYQYIDRAGIPPGVGPAADSPQALMRVDNNYVLTNPGDTVTSCSLTLVIDSIHLEESELYVCVTPLNKSLKEKKSKDVITLVGIGSKDTIHKSVDTIIYTLIKATAGSPYFYNILTESKKCRRDTIETLINDASTYICGTLYTMLWDFKGFNIYVAFNNRFSVKPNIFGVSFSVY